MDRGSAELAEIATMVEACRDVDVMLALARVDDCWQVRHGQLKLYAAEPSPRTWRYAEDAFLERRIPGRVAAGLLGEQPQEIDGLRVVSASSVGNGTFERAAAHALGRPVAMPWPRTQWEIQPQKPWSVRQGGLLIGNGPSFVDYESAFSAFFLDAPPSNQANQQPLWRVVRLDLRAWLARVTVFADALAVVVKGTSIEGVDLELSAPEGRVVRPVGRTRRLRVRLPNGLADGSLLLLRQGDDWLDYRYFRSPGPDRRDPSVSWHQPEAELAVLIGGGEGQHVEFKREVPKEDKSRRTVAKTVAAFASGEGGTLLFGVDDDAQAVGVDPDTLDPQALAIENLVHNSIHPVPKFRTRTAQLDGKTLLLVEVPGEGRWHAVNFTKPEFYVRRGGSTMPARLEEIAAGYRSTQFGRSYALP